jgi:hypothetical protein
VIDPKYLAAFLGFAFVAMWIAVDFGAAILCLLGAAAFWGFAAYLRRELDLTQIQERLGQGLLRRRQG